MVKKRVFIVGCPRSGTTLLQSILAAHEDVTSFPESHFFPSLSPGRRIYRWLGLASRLAYDRLQKFLEEADYQEILPPKSRFGQTQNSAISSFTQCLDKIAERSGSSVWVEKTPRHLWYIDLIEKHVEEPMFIHVVRQGRDVVTSLYQVTHRHAEKWGGARTLQTCIDRWNQDIKITQRHRDKANHHIVRYSDLITDRRTTAKGLFRLINLPVKTDCMADPHSERVVDQIITDEEAWKNNNKNKYVNQTTSKYENILTSFQKEDINQNIIRGLDFLDENTNC